MPSLSDIKVLDLSHALAGPFCTMLLTELGADVIKLEPPGGDHFRPSNSGGTFAAVNRRKRGISIDLRHPQSQGIVERMHRTMKMVGKALAEQDPGHWQDILPYAQLSASSGSYY